MFGYFVCFTHLVWLFVFFWFGLVYFVGCVVQDVAFDFGVFGARI